MHTPALLWRERQSDSPFIESVWTSGALTNASRTVIADPCISIALVKDTQGVRVVVTGPKTLAHSLSLPRGYTCTTIRLKPGVFLKRIPTNQLTNSSVVLPTDGNGAFQLSGSRLRFPDFDRAEELIDQLQYVDALAYSEPERLPENTIEHQSARTRARQSRRVTGLSPYQLYQLQRAHQAFRLLKRGIPAAEVAVELAFVDQSHLIRASKQFLGHTPRQLSDLPQLP